MADKYHIRENGEPGKCDATVRDCPLGDESRHYATPEDARVAYEVTQMANTLPGGISMSEETRERLNLPSANHPAFAGAAPQRSQAEIVEDVRKSGRKKLDEMGIRTYPVTMRNERYVADGVHILEADIPWTAQQQEDFRNFVEENGLTVEERKSRVSVLKTFPSAQPAPSLELIGDKVKATVETEADLDKFDPSTETAFSRPDARSNPKDAVRSLESMRRRAKEASGSDKERFELRLEAQLREVEHLSETDQQYRETLEAKHQQLAHYLAVRSFRS